MWDEWKRVTRFMESARIALLREDTLWDTLELQEPDKAKVHVVNGPSEYEASLGEHRSAVSDEHLFCSIILTYLYALADGAAADRLGKKVSEIGGIEAWGKQLLDAAGNDWQTVREGKSGAVEVAIIRNALAHGSKKYTQTDFNRMANTGLTPLWKAGDAITLTYPLLKEYKSRLKSFLRACNI